MVAGISKIGTLGKTAGSIGMKAVRKTGNAVRTATSFYFSAPAGNFPLNGTPGQKLKHGLISNGILGIANGYFWNHFLAEGRSGWAAFAALGAACNIFLVAANCLKYRLTK